MWYKCGTKCGQIDEHLEKFPSLGTFSRLHSREYFPREQREAKFDEYINLRQGSMSIKESSLKFIKLSKYASFLVSNSRNEINRFGTGVSEDLKEEYR